MRSFNKLTWVELKLFAREPFAVIFTFGFPLIVLIVLINSFRADDEGFGGARPTDYYVASYVGVVIAAVGLIALPVHIATYRERGILRRFRASSLSTLTTIASQVVVGFLMVVAGSAVLMIVGRLAYDARFPESPGLVAIVFVLSTITFLALGVLLGVVTRNARAAQAVGMMLFFPMFLLAGAGPPPDVMSSGMKAVADVLPLTWVLRPLQDSWLDGELNWAQPGMLLIVLVVAAALSIRLFRTA